MTRCYWCGDSASTMVSGVGICEKHHKDFIGCMVKQPSNVKFSTPSVLYPEAYTNFKNTAIAPQAVEA